MYSSTQHPLLFIVCHVRCIPKLFCFLAVAHAFNIDPYRTRPRPLTRLSTVEESSVAEDTTTMNNFASENDKGIAVNGENEAYSTLTPYQILHPNLFCGAIDGFEDMSHPLYVCLDLIREALQRIANDGDHSRSLGPIFSGKHGSPGAIPRVLRIHHKVSTNVDPLCWLDAQQQLLIHRQGETPPLVYFGNAEQSLEAAVCGSAWSHYGVANDELFRFLSSELPVGSQLYGGERFDPETRPDEEWRDFGTGLWILPALELKRTSASTRLETEDMDNIDRPSAISYETVLAVHLVLSEGTSMREAASTVLDILKQVSAKSSPEIPTTTLPPVISRDSSYGPDMDGLEVYERGVTTALREFERSDMEKVVLARRSKLIFDSNHANLRPLEVLKKWKFGGNEGGHLIYLHPGGISGEERRLEFFGCTPERLFQLDTQKIVTEALAGTRPRGTTQEADAALCRDLYESPKDRAENAITGDFIRSTLDGAAEAGLLQPDDKHTTSSEGYFVRRLLHLQHICQRFEREMVPGVNPAEVSYSLLRSLHPTPAMCGAPQKEALQLIRSLETVAFDRGLYSGPFGILGRDRAEIVVAIRSALAETRKDSTSVSVFAGAGIVPGSTVQGEWSETSYKLNVISSLFPPSPITLSGAATPNVAWAAAFVEELVRCGVTQFYVCPGSRSTPLVVAISKALRGNVGVVNAVSVHDERAAGFRALGYARAHGIPAAVITSSGTATANLYPAVMEAGMDAVPLILLTADRPYENRDTGANQAVDQVKMYSSTYLRWFRDIPAPTDDVPVSLALSDANHAVMLARQQRGPVQLNIQFRENLAPDPGPIRNDPRVDSVVRFNSFRFSDVPGFERWSNGGEAWMRSFSSHEGDAVDRAAVDAIARLVRESNRGIIVVGHVRSSATDSDPTEAISQLAETIGFPVFAGVQSAELRFRSSAVIPFAEHILKHKTISDNLNPDLVIQVGHPLISTELPAAIKKALSKVDTSSLNYVFVHPHHPSERSDPDLVVTHRISSAVTPFLAALQETLANECGMISSELTSLVALGKALRDEIPRIIEEASREVIGGSSTRTHPCMTEPQIVLAMTRSIGRNGISLSLFLSNSMPVRDAEFFLYPLQQTQGDGMPLHRVGVNRGASGIDGIISTATGFAEGVETPTTLLIGDLASLHDINAFHGLAKRKLAKSKGSKPLTTIIVNNDGGGIFSFLPIAKHGQDVNFNEFFGTETNSFSFEQGITAFGVPCVRASSIQDLSRLYSKALDNEEDFVIEAAVVSRAQNVQVHMQITASVVTFLDRFLEKSRHKPASLPIRSFPQAAPDVASSRSKTMLLLHGWMGDKHEFDEVGMLISEALSPEWKVISVDLPAHGGAPLERSSTSEIVRESLGLLSQRSHHVTVDYMAEAVLTSLNTDHGVKRIDAVVGYSLGGRVALAMKRLSAGAAKGMAKLWLDAKLVLLCSNPGLLPEATSTISSDMLGNIALDSNSRYRVDVGLSSELVNLARRAEIQSRSTANALKTWNDFLSKWYGAPLWSDLEGRHLMDYRSMVSRRAQALSNRARDLAAVLKDASPATNGHFDWQAAVPEHTLFVHGELDIKYAGIGRQWKGMFPGLSVGVVEGSGHAVLTENSHKVASLIIGFALGDQEDMPLASSPADSKAPTRISRVPLASLVNASGNTKKQEEDEASVQLGLVSVADLHFEPFVIDMINEQTRDPGLVGIGWGQRAEAKETNRIQRRAGYVLQVTADDGSVVGIGECSPLGGLHEETLSDVSTELSILQQKVRSTEEVPSFDAREVLRLDGGLAEYIDSLMNSLGMSSLSESSRSALEMALLSCASQFEKVPILKGLSSHLSTMPQPTLALNGLVTRGSVANLADSKADHLNLRFRSVKVKVGHQDMREDVAALSRAFREVTPTGKIRADANRAWDDSTAIQCASELSVIDVDAMQRLEFVEEPLRKVEGSWTLQHQVIALERWYQHTGVKYALDESVSDLIHQHDGDFGTISKELIQAFSEDVHGCAALVLKPALLGLEFSTRLARLAHSELGVGAVISSSFDSGVGLAYASFIAAIADTSVSSEKKRYAHGLGTFTMLANDTLSPSFGSYVSERGGLQVASLSRALFGLGLDEMIGSFQKQPLPHDSSLKTEAKAQSDDYQATTATSSSGREISVVVSLPLPFSDDVAASRFCDLPQASRWSPWLSSVAYLDAGRETEWTLNVRGVRLSWRATSTILETPYRGISWESVSGLQNMGVVEFIPAGSGECLMKVRMKIFAPRIIATLFPGASVFLEDFLQNKLMKWSLEMFRDVVKGDLALERGDVELGDALFGSVEGKANAIEATLSLPLDDAGLKEETGT